MNATIANLILARIDAASLAWVDKFAGLSRPVKFKNQGTELTLPVACSVTDELACTVDRVNALVPDEKYRSLMFFEGQSMPERISKRGIGNTYKSRLRLVVWINCDLLGGSCNCGDNAYQSIVSAVESRSRYATSNMTGIRHRVLGGITRGSEVFGKYTFDEIKSQYLNVPFDFFALDIETDFNVMPGCETDLAQDDVSCYTPGSDQRKRYAKDFTCEELQDPDNGLTAEQLGVDCLDCAGGGPCDTTFTLVVNVNGTEILNADYDSGVDNTINLNLI